jgi:predicted metalloendopeptidase
VAWQAWQRTRGPHPDDTPIDGFTPEQRFFIAYAQARAANMTPELERRSIQSDPHPISRLRVNGPLSNMPEFASAFGCRAGDPMVRANRCQIW